MDKFFELGTNHDEKAANAVLESTGTVGGIVAMELPVLLKRRDEFDDSETNTVSSPLNILTCGMSYVYTHRHTKTSTNIWKFCFCLFTTII